MVLHFEELLKQITEFIRTEAKTETVVGEQFKLGEFILENSAFSIDF